MKLSFDKSLLDGVTLRICIDCTVEEMFKYFILEKENGTWVTDDCKFPLFKKHLTLLFGLMESYELQIFTDVQIGKRFGICTTVKEELFNEINCG